MHKKVFFILFFSIFFYFISIFISSSISFAATEFVSSIMESGGDYNTLSSWEAAINTDLTTSTTKVFSGTKTGTIADAAGVTLYRASSSQSITATVKHATDSQILVASISSSTYSFQSGDQWRVDSSNYFQISDTGDSAIATAKIDGAWTTADTTNVEIDGWTTTSTNYIRIYTTATARHNGTWSGTSTNKYLLSISTATPNIGIAESDVTIEGLQLLNTSNSMVASAVINGTGVGNIKIISNIAKATQLGIGNAFEFAHSANTGHIYFINNVAIGPWTTGFYIRGASATARGVSYNNTAYGNVDCFRSRSGYNYAKNNIAFGCTTNSYLESEDYLVADYNGYSSGTDPGTNGIDLSGYATSSVFVDADNGDFHLTPTSPAKNVGLDLTNDAIYSFIDDIDGQTRPTGTGTWDIGADEFVNTAPNAPVSLGQYTSGCSSSISTSTYWISTSTVCFTGLISDTDINDLEKLQIELSTSTFSNSPNYTASLFTTSTATSSAVATATSSITVSSLPDGNYKWQARLLDYSNGTSSFTQFNSGSNSFGIDTTAPTGTIPAPTFGTITSSSIIINRPSTSTITESGSGLYQWQARRNSSTTLSAVSTSSTTTSDTGLSSNTQYAYDVRFTDVTGNTSPYGATSSKYTLTPDPTNFSATPSQTSNNLSVDSFNNASSGSSGYYFSNTTNSNNSGWITTNSWTDTALTCNTSYSYTIQYRNGDGTGSATSSVSQTTSACSVSAATANAGLPISILSPAQSAQSISRSQPASQYQPSQYQPVSFTKPLYLGLNNEDVRNLQSFLSNPSTGGPDIYPEALITGYFGPLTKQAVERFQLKYNITDESDPAFGYVGPKTRAKLNQLLTTNYKLPTGAGNQQPSLNQTLTDLLKQKIQLIETKIQELLKQIQALKPSN